MEKCQWVVGSDGNVLYLVCDGGFPDLCTWENTADFYFHVCGLLTINHTLIKPLKCHQYINIIFACVCMHMYLCGYVGLRIDITSLNQLLCILFFWDKISHWTWSPWTAISWLVNELPRSLCLRSPSPEPKSDLQPCSAFTRCLFQLQVLMLVWQAL